MPCRLEKMVIDEINRLSAEYLDKDELEQNIEFCNNLQGQKKRLISEIAAYNKKLQNTQKVFVNLYGQGKGLDFGK